MAKKRTRHRTKKTGESTDNLIRRAEGHMTAGRHKDAIDAYKRLLKKEPSDKWRELLAQAYLARAHSLAAKAMYQEALVMWENRAHLGFEGEFGAYIGWLLRAGRQEKALNRYQAWKDKLEQVDVARIEAFLASLVLARNSVDIEGLTEESPVVRHYPQIKAVISAYCRGDDVGLASLLKAIPYRSPYRDFRTVFSAFILLPEQPQAALKMLDRLATESPFQGFAQIVRIAASGELKKLNTLGQAGKQFIAEIKGIDPQHLPLLHKLNRDAGSPKALFGHLLVSSKNLGKETLQPLCQSLLTAYPAGIRQYNQRFEPLSDFAVARIQALEAEQRNDSNDAAGYWRRAYTYLSKDSQQNQNLDEKRLRQALILRHSAELYERAYGENYMDIEEPLLISLEVDPDDKPTYLKLLGFYQASEEEDDYRKILERALKQFPEDTEILLTAVKLAIRRNTFKKAVKLANKILEKDPLNMPVRVLLIEAHLAHARKQMLNKRLDLAEKEIEDAQQMERKGFESGLVNLYRGLLAHKQGNPDLAKIQIEQACGHIGCDLRGYFRVIIEAGRIQLPTRDLKPYQKALKQTAAKPPIKSDVIALLKVIQQYNNEKQKTVNAALTPLGAYLKKAAQLDFTRDEMEMLCEIWQTTGLFPHLQTFTKQARRAWPEEPVFMYYEVYAASAGGTRPLKYNDRNTLMQAMESLRGRENPKLAELILDLIGPFSLFDMVAQAFEFDDDDDDDEYDDSFPPFMPF